MSTTNSNEPQQGGVTDETAEFGDRPQVPVAGSTENHGEVEQPVAPGTDDDNIIGVINDLVSGHATFPNAMRASANSASAPPPTARNNMRVLRAKLLPGS